MRLSRDHTQRQHTRAYPLFATQLHARAQHMAWRTILFDTHVHAETVELQVPAQAPRPKNKARRPRAMSLLVTGREESSVAYVVMCITRSPAQHTQSEAKPQLVYSKPIPSIVYVCQVYKPLDTDSLNFKRKTFRHILTKFPWCASFLAGVR